MADLTGRVLSNRYRVEAYLGRGGMAEVYRAYDTRRSYPVAVKVMHPDLAEDAQFVDRFRREAQSLAGLAHENIVRFYSLEKEGALAFLVMDFVDGVTLRTLLAQTGGPLPLPHIAHIFPQICRALHYAHHEGVIHRDIKPGNVMVQANGRVLVTDFGIAKAADAATLTTYMPGTPAYMSPEQCRNEPANLRSDIYSLGIVLYELVTGQRPFGGQTEAATGSTREKIRWEQVHGTPPLPGELNPQLPPMLTGIILKAMNKQPDARFSTVQGLLESFEIAMGGITPAAPPVYPAPTVAGPVSPPPVTPPPTAVWQTPPPAHPAGSRRVWAVLAAGAIFLLAVAAVGWLALGREKSPPPAAQESSPTAPAETATETLDLQKTCLERGPAIVTQPAEVRTGPGEDFGNFAALPAGSEIIVTGQNHKGTWWQIFHPAGPEGHGWIDRDYADTQQDLCPPALTVTLPSPTPPPTAVPPPTPTPQTVVIDTLPAAVLNKIAPATPARGDTLSLTPAAPSATPPPPPTQPPAAPPTPALPPDCPDARATIKYPRDGDTIRGNVHFLGTADLPNLRKYIIEYRPAGDTNWRFLLVKDFTWVKNGDVLFTFVTSTIPPGTYDFRLTVVDMTGNYPDPCEVTVTVRH